MEGFGGIERYGRISCSLLFKCSRLRHVEGAVHVAIEYSNEDGEHCNLLATLVRFSANTSHSCDGGVIRVMRASSVLVSGKRYLALENLALEIC